MSQERCYHREWSETKICWNKQLQRASIYRCKIFPENSLKRQNRCFLRGMSKCLDPCLRKRTTHSSARAKVGVSTLQELCHSMPHSHVPFRELKSVLRWTGELWSEDISRTDEETIRLRRNFLSLFGLHIQNVLPLPCVYSSNVIYIKQFLIQYNI